SDIYVVGGTFRVTTSSVSATGSLLVTTPGAVDIQYDMILNGSSMTNTGTITSVATPTVTMNGQGTLGGTGSTVLPTFSMTGSAKITTLSGAVTLLGDFINASGHIYDANNASSFATTVAGNWNNSGTFSVRSSSVTMNGSTTNTLIATSNQPFYNLRFNGT